MGDVQFKFETAATRLSISIVTVPQLCTVIMYAPKSTVNN